MAGIPVARRGKTRRHILQDAVDLVTVQGFGALTVNGLCAVTAMPASQVRYYFNNTAHLLFQVVDDLLKATLNGLDAPAGVSADECLLRLCRSYATLRAGALARHLATVPFASLLPRQTSILRYKQRLILQTFQEAVGGCRPTLGHAEIMVLSLSLVALLDGYAIWSREPGAMDPDAYADLARRMILAV